MSGLITAPSPIIKKRFRMQEPMRLPIAKPSVPFSVAVMDVINSGSAVPMPTIVKPIMLSGTAIVSPMILALSTAKSAPNLRATKPNAINNMEIIYIAPAKSALKEKRAILQTLYFNDFPKNLTI